MDHVGDSGAIPVRIMNEYEVQLPLWSEDGLVEDGDFPLTESMRSDLMAFARRWEATVPDEVWDDRYDDEPVRRTLVDLGRTARRWANPSARRAEAAENAQLQAIGEDLARRLQAELGPRYIVTYHHW